MTRLGDLVAINPPASRHLEPGRLIALADIDPLSASANPRPVATSEEVASHHHVALPGDILFPQISPSMENGKLALVPDLDSDAVLVSGELLVLRPEKGVEKEKIWAFLRRKALRDALSEYMVGTTRRRLGREVLEAVEVPEVSPRRWSVAAEVLALLDRATQLRRGVLEDMRRLPGVAAARVASGSERVRRGEVADIAAGISERAARTGAVPLLGAANLKDGSVDDAAGFVPEGAPRVPLLRRGDLLLSRAGAALGKGAVYEDKPPEASFSAGLARVRGLAPLSAEVLWAWLQTAEAERHLRACVTGATAPRLPLDVLADFPVPAPHGPWTDLAPFAHAVRMALSAANRQLELLEDLLQAHLARVFEGPVSVPETVVEEVPSQRVPAALRDVFERASPPQRQIWLDAATMRGQFRVADLIDSELDRALLQHTLSMLEQLGVLVCERDGVIASWRLPPEEDLVE